MKQGIILLTITLILIAVCGCTQTPATPPPQTNPTTPSVTTESQTFVTTPTQQKTPAVSDNTIRIKNLAFDRENISVRVGSTVRWVNLDSVPHRVVFEDGADSTVLAASQSWSRKFDEAGTYKVLLYYSPDHAGNSNCGLRNPVNGSGNSLR